MLNNLGIKSLALFPIPMFKLKPSFLVATAVIVCLLGIILPQNGVVYAANQVTGYKLPWPAGQAYTATGVRTSHTAFGNPPVPRQAIDFGTPWQTPVLAMKAGDIVYSRNIGGDTNGFVVIDHNDGYCSVYVHLSSLEFGTITSGRRAIAVGQRIGLSGRLRTNGAIHLHIAVYSRSSTGCGMYSNTDKQREQVIIFDEAGRELNYGDRIVSQNTFNIPTNQNVVRNGSFSSGITNWVAWNIPYAIYNNVLAFKRETNNPNGVIYQDINYNIPSGTPIEIRFQAGNSSRVDKVLGIHLHNSASWTGAIQCWFRIPANTPLGSYIIQGITNNVNWPTARLEFAPDPADSIPDVLLDNVSLMHNTNINPAGTQCTR